MCTATHSLGGEWMEIIMEQEVVTTKLWSRSPKTAKADSEPGAMKPTEPIFFVQQKRTKLSDFVVVYRNPNGTYGMVETIGYKRSKKKDHGLRALRDD